jgi:hypothetical protein
VKNPIITLGLTAFLLSAGFLACQKYSSSNSGASTNVFPPDVMVTASVQGRVVDQGGVPVAGATVSSGTASTSTDVNGVFTFRNISLSSRFGYIQAAKSGYFTGSRSIATNGAESNFITIQLITRAETGNFPAASGGKIMVYSGDTVSFAPSSVVAAATNTAYTGTVHVFATYLNPTNDNFLKYMPGDLRGINTAGTEVTLQSYGMMDVELRDDAGNKLQLASGQSATLTLPIPDALQSSAPSTIPLWYFNDSTGRWMQQGSATRQGNNYVGTVGHFTWWNFDVIYVPHNFKAHVRDQAGNPVAYMHAVLYANNAPLFSGYTDSTGYIKGWLPDGVEGQLKLVTECGNILGGVNVGPALADVDLGTITVTIPQTGLTVTGTVVDCFNNPVANGYVNVYIDGLNYRAGVTNGKFTLSLTRCYNGNATAQITAGDLGTAQQGGTVTQNDVQPGTLDVGTLSACGTTINQFLTITVNGNTYSNTTSANLQYSSGRFFSSGAPYTDFTIQGLTGPGTWYPSSLHLFAGGHAFGLAGANVLQCNISNFGAVNQFITGTLNGNVYDSTSQAATLLTGSFKFIRTN